LQYYENGGGAAVWFYRLNSETGWVIAPGSEFTQSSATTQQLQALASAEATLAQEQDELEVLDLQEDVAQQNLLGAQQNLVAAQTAVTAMETAVSDAQTAITKTVEAIAAVQTAQTTVQEEVILQSPIEAPSNIVVTQLENGDVQVSWDPPSGIISPERYAISWSVGDSGWGIATGNAGDANALNTSIVLSASLFESTGGLDTTYQISVRSDNDSLAKYSSVVATQILIADPTPEPPTPPVEPPVEPPTPPVEPEEPPVEPEEPPVEPEEPPVEPSHLLNLKSHLSNLKSHLSNLKSHLSNLKSHLSNQKNLLSNQKNLLLNLKSHLSNLKSHLSNQKNLLHQNQNQHKKKLLILLWKMHSVMEKLQQQMLKKF
jgi:hypothetical protein